jgi:putative radical SAM enzyme (TIGR03279 family)
MKLLSQSPAPMIRCIDPTSPAYDRLRESDRIIRINGHPVRDLIDLQFYGSDPDLVFEIERKGRTLRIRLDNPDLHPLNIDLAPLSFGCCGNQCSFCFVDQNPRGLRRSLYVKDEEFRLSFLHGNYVTLTRVTQADLNRIAEQRLSPLYLSIHAVDSRVRRSLLGLKQEDHLLDKLAFLADHEIQMHGQIVLCPGVNDGSVLTDTIESLTGFYPHLKTLAVVPVGLTRHRTGLTPLEPVLPAHARQLIEQYAPFQRDFQSRTGDPFLYFSDEFYLLAGLPLPPDSHYLDYWQIENGVGMTRQFIDRLHAQISGFPKRLDSPDHAVIVTGTLAAPVLSEQILPHLIKIEHFEPRLLPVQNDFFGRSVTVSGLLTGQDIARAVSRIDGSFRILLPVNCLNTDGLFLDDWTPDRLREATGHPVDVISGFDECWN